MCKVGQGSCEKPFPLPPRIGKPGGSGKFRLRHVQPNLVTGRRQLIVGENLNLEIELLNAGKSSALLIKMTELVPQGFELAEKPEMNRLEDSYLNMKGKRVDLLKTEEVKLILMWNVQGEFSLNPMMLYLDENGKCKSQQPEPVTTTARELGIKGWFKGER